MNEQNPPRFQKGDRVMCQYRKDESIQIGTIVGPGYRDLQWTILDDRSGRKFIAHELFLKRIPYKDSNWLESESE